MEWTPDMAATWTPCNRARLADRESASARERFPDDGAMIDFAAARRMMVDGQVRTSDVTDPRIIAAMLELPRERFVPEGRAALTYLDLDLPVTDEAGPGGRYLLKPMVLAKLLQAADVGRDACVLDVACGTGYSSALLAQLARSVVALEDDPILAQRARETLVSLGFANVEVATGPLPDGWPSGGPYDVILLNGTAEVAPRGLLRQLREGGRLVGVVGRRPASKAVVYVSAAGHVSATPIFDASAPPLPAFAAPAAFVF
jgi:protein-L-isoaspartate(D-aspartate) O-methyltransferase